MAALHALGVPQHNTFCTSTRPLITRSKFMKDLTDSRWIKFKGILFLFLGFLSSGLLLFEHPEIRTAVLLGIAIWGFCRFYYFAFYVIEHYVEPGYRFSGLWSFARYLLARNPEERSNKE
jgi:hypothetical protein